MIFFAVKKFWTWITKNRFSYSFLTAIRANSWLASAAIPMLL
jgi:hypothetical protein